MGISPTGKEITTTGIAARRGEANPLRRGPFWEDGERGKRGVRFL